MGETTKQIKERKWQRAEPYHRLNQHFPTWGQWVPIDFKRARVCADFKAQLIEEALEDLRDRAKKTPKARYIVHSPKKHKCA